MTKKIEKYISFSLKKKCLEKEITEFKNLLREKVIK